MDCEHKLKVLEQEIESLKEENRLLKEKLSSSEKNFDGVSFKEKYAVRILDSLPDMLTVFNHEEMGIEVVSNEETNHVGVSNNDFKGMRMQDMVPKEAYIIRKSKFPQNPKRSVRFSGKRTKRSVQKRKARNTQKAETKVL